MSNDPQKLILQTPHAHLRAAILQLVHLGNKVSEHDPSSCGEDMWRWSIMVGHGACTLTRTAPFFMFQQFAAGQPPSILAMIEQDIRTALTMLKFNCFRPSNTRTCFQHRAALLLLKSEGNLVLKSRRSRPIFTSLTSSHSCPKES